MKQLHTRYLTGSCFKMFKHMNRICEIYWSNNTQQQSSHEYIDKRRHNQAEIFKQTWSVTFNCFDINTVVTKIPTSFGMTSTIQFIITM